MYEIVQNASDEPIWDVIVNAPIIVEKTKGSDELEFAESEDEVISIEPHETCKSQITAMSLAYNRLPLRVEIRDNAGKEWRRDDRDRLHCGRTSEPSFSIFDETAKEKAGQQRDGKDDSPIFTTRILWTSYESRLSKNSIITRVIASYMLALCAWQSLRRRLGDRIAGSLWQLPGVAGANP